MNFKKVRQGLFVDLDKVDIVEYEAVREYDDESQKLKNFLNVNIVLSTGAKVPSVFSCEFKHADKKDLERAELECEAFVLENFINKK